MAPDHAPAHGAGHGIRAAIVSTAPRHSPPRVTWLAAPDTFGGVSTKGVVRAVVIGVWGAAMIALGLRASRDALPAAPVAAVREPAHERDEAWHGVYGDGRKVGYSHRVRTPVDGGFRVETDTSIALKLLGSEQPVLTHLSAETDRALRLKSFDFRMRSGPNDVTIAGIVHDGALDISSNKLGKQTIPLSAETPLTLSETLQDFLGTEDLKPGKTLRYSVFDPVGGAPASITLTVGPLETVDLPGGARSAYRVEQTYQSSHFDLWVEPGGEVVKEQGPLGLTIVREIDAASAIAGVDPHQGLDLASAAAIPVSKKIDSPRSVQHLSMRLAGITPDAALSSPPRQRLDGNRVTIEREPAAAIRTFQLPEREPRFADDLRATPFLQVDDPRIQKLAAEIVAGSTDARTAAERIVAWVHDHLKKVPTVSIPNAVQVLDLGQGDCNEHAVLAAALTRAAGLPTRIASGAVYLAADGDGPGAFYYHAWNEVWLGDWTAVDATFGQFPADATHLKLATGGPEGDMSLVGIIGHLRLDILDAS